MFSWNFIHPFSLRLNYFIFFTIPIKNKIIEKGEVYGTGLNNQGQLGLGTKSNVYTMQKTQFPLKSTPVIIKVASGTFSGCLTSEGQIYIWGRGVFGEFLKPTLLSKNDDYFIDIQINDGFGLCLDSQSNIYSWGENLNGQLGLGNLENKMGLTLVKKLKGKNINKFSNGITDFCVCIGDFTLKNVVLEGFEYF